MPEPMTMAAIAAGVGALGSGLASMQGGKEAARAQRAGIKSQENMYWDYVRRLEEIGIPSDEASKIALEMYAQPEELSLDQLSMEDVQQVDDSQYQGIMPSEQFRAPQIEALNRLQEISSSTGLDAIAQAQMDEAFQKAASQERSQRGAVTQGMQRRGMAGGGLEFAGQMQAQQAGADRSKSAALETGALAQERALQALMDGAGLAGNLSQEDLALQTEQARASDAINKFNAQAMQRAQEVNMNAQREAQLRNWSAGLDIANKNTDLRNKMAQFKAGEDQRRFDNEMKRTQAMQRPMEGIGQSQASMGEAKGREKGAMWDALGKTASTAGKLGYDYYASQAGKAPDKTSPNPFTDNQYEAEEADIWQRKGRNMYA